MDEVGWIVRRISELGGFENVSDSVKADVFGFDIADISGSIKLFSDVMRNFRGFMMKVLVEMLIKERWKIR